MADLVVTDWMQEIRLKYKNNISNTFILTGNIGDYASKETMFLKEYLTACFFSELFKKNEVYIHMPYNPTYGAKSGKIIETFKEVVGAMSDPNGNSAFIMYYPEFIIPEDARGSEEAIICLHNTLNSPKYITSNNIVVIVTDSTKNINQMFLGSNSKTTVLNINLPDYGERMSFIKNYISSHPTIERGINYKVDQNTIANLTAGLQRIAIEDIFLYAKSKGYIDERMIFERKAEVIQKEFGETLEIYDTAGYSLDDFAGQEDIKRYFKETVIDAIKQNQLDIVPKGVLLMGPPGTGKTYFSRCLAGDSGINFVEFKMSKILGKYVGESEKAMEKALSVFRALAPVGVFMDEIDQSMSRGEGGSDGGSQVNANIFGMLLSEMSKPENRGKILWLAATNYPNNVDEALKRAGRFDKKIPFFAPNMSEREAVFALHLAKSNMRLNENINLSDLAERTDGYTQAEIEAIVVKALELCKRAKETSITMERLNLAMEYMLSSQNSKIREMEDIALRECNDQEFIPEQFKERHKLLMKSDSNRVFGGIDSMDRENKKR